MALINQMSGDQILDESLTGADLKDGTVEGSTANSAGTQKDIKQGTISTPDLRDGAVTAAKAATGTTDTTLCVGNDSRIPTQDENDALAGTQGAPSSTNKYITNSDMRIVPLWISGTTYTAGQLVINNTLLYRCITGNSDATFTVANWYCLGDIMTGAAAGTAGKIGLVPTPAAGDNIKALFGDGTYKLPKIIRDTGYLRTNIGVDTAWYEFAQFLWSGSATVGVPSSFQIMLKCAVAAVTYSVQIANITDSTTFLASSVITDSSIIGYNSNTFTSFSTVPSAGPKLMSIQITAAAGAKKNVQLTGSLLVIN